MQKEASEGLVIMFSMLRMLQRFNWFLFLAFCVHIENGPKGEVDVQTPQKGQCVTTKELRARDQTKPQ